MLSFREAITEKTSSALAAVFNQSYPDPLLQNAYVGPEFPLTRETLPAIIVLFQANKVQNMGLGHLAYIEDATGQSHLVHQWRYEGQLQFEVNSYSTLDRSKIIDQLINLLAFGYDADVFKPFWNEINDSDFIALTMLTDSINQGFPSETQSPWGDSNELIYKSSLTVGICGEFFSDAVSASLVTINQVRMYPYRPDQNPPNGSGVSTPWST